MPEASGAGSSHASIMQSDDENVRECEKGRCKMVFRDLEAGLPIDSSSLDEEEMHSVDLRDDRKPSGHLEATNEAVSAEVYDHHDDCCDVRALVDTQLRAPLLAHVETDNIKSSQGKEVLLSGEHKLGGDSLEKEGEVHGLRKQRGPTVDSLKPFVIGDSGGGKMPEEEKRGVTGARTKDASTDIGQETKQPKPVEKKASKQGKGTVKPSAVRRVGEAQPLEDLRAKEEAETNRKVHESLDNFLRQTIRCDSYMNFTGRPGDKPLQRLRPDVFENHVAGKLARGFKVDGGSDSRDIGLEENLGIDGLSSDGDGFKDASITSTKGIAGLGRGPQHSLKVPPGVVAFTQAAAKGTDLQGWLSPSKIAMTKCEKCTREFCSSLNYRRHVRVHRRSLNPEKEDLSKERSKVAAFWDKLTPEEASNIVHYDNMEIEELSGQSALKALAVFIQQPGLPSLPQGVLKAGALLLDIVQSKASVFPLSSERLLSILDDASERTFLCGGTSVAVQRFIFNGDAGKVGLEEKNLVASMGFHIELKLVKAWMADKEAEALRCQQALFKEEEAAQQKRAKLLEKKRMKKIRQKERKGNVSQPHSQELETESVDDDGNIQGIGEEDDSATATGSCSSSLISAQDSALQESADIDMCEDLSLVDMREENAQALGEDMAKSKIVDDGLSLEQLLSPYRHERSTSINHLHVPEAFGRKDDLFIKDAVVVDRGENSSVRVVDEGVGDACVHGASAQPSGRIRTLELQLSLPFRKAEQDRVASDLKRRESDRSATERRMLRTQRERPRNDYPESTQKHGRDSRGFDGRYGDGPSQMPFKPVRKANAYFVRTDVAISDLSSAPRLKQYRSKVLGTSRNLSTAGNGQVVWTRKVQQPAPVEVTKDRKEEIIDDVAISKAAASSGGCEQSRVFLEAPTSHTDSAEGDADTTKDKEVLEKKEVAVVAPVSLEDSRLAGSSNDVMIPAKESSETDEDGLVGGALLVGSLSVPLGKFGMVSISQVRVRSCAHSCQPDHAEVANVSAAQRHDDCHGMPQLTPATQEAVPLVIDDPAGDTESSDLSDKYLSSPHRANGARPQPIVIQPGKSKSHLSLCSPERGDGSRHGIALQLGNERLVAKQGSWQSSAGRYVSAKVWRAVGMVGDRHDSTPGLHAGGESASSFGDGRPLQDEVDLSGQSESERGNSPKLDFGHTSPTQSHFVRDDLCEGHDHSDDRSLVNSSSLKDSDEQPFPSALILTRSVESGSDVLVEEKAGYSGRQMSGNGVNSGVLASGFCSFSDFVEVAGTFFKERWRMALAQASAEEVLVLTSEGGPKEREGINFLEMLFLQLSDRSSRHCPGAESSLSPSSSLVTKTLGNPANDPGMFLSRIFSDSDQTGVEDVRCNSTTDEQRLDGASEESGNPQAVSSEDDGGMREASSSPVDSEHYMSGSETTRTYTLSAASVGRVEVKQCERRGGSGSVGSSHGRHGNGRLERWYRGPRDRFLEQRYMPRRRAPLEKNC